ncbi:Dimethylaniline monooxygenase [N-oxide-forming] 5, partial [Fulmarus glacialis]
AQRVAIIGAGVSGLCALKCCLDEGLVPTCFERSGDIGGLWRFEERPEEGRASIYRSVIINTSKEMMCFSDFPIPEDFPNYMHNSKVMEYYYMYARHFDLLRHVRFRTSVCRVAKRPDFATTGQWEVVTESQGKQEAAIFDAVLVCTGHHTEAHLPLSTFPGLEKFEGWYLHSRDYKSSQPFSGKQVVVVGTGNSGVDIAVELSHSAKQVFLSTRRGTWVLHRVGDGGYPFDFTYLSRFMQLFNSLLPQGADFLLRRKLNARFHHALYGLPTRNRVVGCSQAPLAMARLSRSTGCIPSHTASLHAPLLSSFCLFIGTKTRVAFCNEPRAHLLLRGPLTGPIACKPPSPSPFLPLLSLPVPPALFLLDCPCHRYPCAHMPSPPALPACRYVKSQRHTIQVDYIPYMDELACQVGVKPNLLALFLTDPKLALEVVFGPCTPYQYRLRGPGKWAGAREAILTQRQRVVR